MKKYLLPQNGQFYKANLHSHSTVSDGKLTPEEMKKIYMDKGYSVIAYTDHNIFVGHKDLCDENFVALNGYELDINEEGEVFKEVKCCHFCLIALEPDNLTQVCYHRTKYMKGNAEAGRSQVKFDETLPDYERVYTPECISEMMQTGRDNGFFVIYSHPAWSSEEKEQYCNYHGMHAMEIVNYGCLVEGYTEYNDKEYDQMLRNGEEIYCVAVDDNHNYPPMDSRAYDAFGGFTMIKAEKLGYKEITNALLAGDFYASQGPEIKELWIEDNMLFVKCSSADRIVLNTGIRLAQTKYKEDEPLTEASFEIKPGYKYFRITVIDEKGLHANTNAYFVRDWL